MVEKAGSNVDELPGLLLKNALAELATFYCCTIIRVNLTGLEGENIKEIAETARIEDRNHFEASEFMGEAPSGHFLHRGRNIAR